MDNLIYEPLKYYTSYAKDAHAQNVSDHFDALLSSSKIDVEENRKWVREYEAQLEIIKKFDIKGNVTDIDNCGDGHINSTFLAVTDAGEKYLLQKILLLCFLIELNFQFH